MDPETFLVEWYVLADTFCQTALPPDQHPGPAAALARSEVVSLAVLSQWARFRSERDFWRYATTRLRASFPRLPSRPQCNRQVRRQQAAITAFALWLAEQLDATAAPYEALDGSAVPMTPSGLYQICKRISDDSGIHVAPHKLRHTFAISYLRAVGNAFALQKLLGHTTLHTTLTYVAMTNDDLVAEHRQHSPVDAMLRKRK